MATDTRTDELIELETQYWQALKDRDAQACVDLSHDPCLVAGAHGVGSYTKAEMLAMNEKEQPYTIDEFELKEVHARMLWPDVGIVAYTVKQTLTVDGEKVTFEAADTSTWVRTNGQWACAMHSESILGDPFGRNTKK